MDIKRFTIGDWVVVTAVTEFHTRAGKRDSTRTEFQWPKLGQITGIGKRYEGSLCETGSTDWETGSVEGGLEFAPDKQVMGWLVRFGLSNKEQFVLPEDLEPTFKKYPASPGVVGKIPYQQGKYLWKPRDREAAREAMKSVKRDEKGRWLK